MSKINELAYIVPTNLAGLGQRFIAQWIDAAITMLICFIGFKFCDFIGLFLPGFQTLGFLFVIIGVAYWLGRDGLPGGQGLGKRILKIHVVTDVFHVNCSAWQSVARNIPSIFLPFDWWPIFFGSRKRIGDMLASTVVLKKG
jgi:uncharacterized RDD family membrane protein YckC